MYTFNFIHETDTEKQLDVEVSMTASGDEHCIEEIKVYDALTGDDIAFETLNEAMQTAIEKKADDLSYDYADEAYQDACQSAGDMAYEMWREGQWS